MQAEKRKTFDLDIVFVGLCMLVKDGKRLHVLLPRSAGAHEHEAKLFVHPSFIDGEELPGAEEPAEFELKNRQLDLTRLKPSDSPDLDFAKSNVFDLGTFVDRKVPRHLLETGSGTTEPNACAARVTLAAGKMVKRKKGSFWKLTRTKPSFEEFRGHMAIAVRWRIKDVEGDSITLQLMALNNAAGRDETATLFAVSGRIELWVYHSPKDDLPSAVPPDPKTPIAPDDCKAPHFGMYYDLLPAVLEAPVPDLLFLDTANQPTHETDPGTTGASPSDPCIPKEAPATERVAGERGAGREAADAAGTPGSGDHPHQGEHGTAGEFADAAAGDEVACIMVTATAAAT